MKKKKQNKITNSAFGWGIVSALLASLCCLGPLALIFLGIGSASTALSIGYQKPYFLIFGLMVLAYGFFHLYRQSCQNTHLSKKQQFTIFGGAFTIAVLLYYFLSFIIAPLLAPLVYQLRYGK